GETDVEAVVAKQGLHKVSSRATTMQSRSKLLSKRLCTRSVRNRLKTDHREHWPRSERLSYTGTRGSVFRARTPSRDSGGENDAEPTAWRSLRPGARLFAPPIRPLRGTLPRVRPRMSGRHSRTGTV